MLFALASASKIKLDALKKALPTEATVTTFNIDSSDQCPQPFDEGGLVACRNRIRLVLSEDLDKHNYIIAIENFIDTKKEEDIAVCICYNIRENWETIVYSEGTDLLDGPNSPLLKKLMTDWRHKDGAQVTYGKLYSNMHPGVPHDNWFKNKNRGELITAALRKLLEPVLDYQKNIKEPVLQAFRHFPDFPKPGVNFADWSNIFLNADLVKRLIKHLAKKYEGTKIDYVMGLESRGYFIALPLSLELNAGFVPLKKPGKTPGPVITRAYKKEYGNDILELRDDLPHGNVLIVDDVLATGGSLEAGIDLAIEAGHTVIDAITIMDIPFLRAETQKRLSAYPIRVLL